MLKIIAAFARGLLRALGFLTRLPVPEKYYQYDHDRISDSSLYPLVGALIGIAGGVVFALFAWLGFSALLNSLFATAAIIIFTGGLHEDGLSDVADSFFAPKAHDAQARLAIMKDSHNGVFGMLALILFIGLRVSLLADIADMRGTGAAISAFIVAEAVSRTGMVMLWPSLPLVSLNSIAHTIGFPLWGDAVKAMLIGIALLFLLSLYHANFILLPLVCLLLGSALFLFRRLCQHKIGGLCGDCLGAAQQIGIIVILASLHISFGF